ncbi:MAG: DUF3467 domain-containing protein [Planctomycetaceae bacterium]|nr:DUF3467 domain-containing protein [Planctomycetaceae bacterium]
MTNEPEPWRDEPSDPPPGGQSFSQNLKHTAIGARVPETVRSGVFCTGTTILQTTEEFVIDFLSTMVPPQQVVARVVLTPNTFAQFIAALQANLTKYQQQFGRLLPHARTETPPAPSVGESQEVVAAAGPIGTPEEPADLPGAVSGGAPSSPAVPPPSHAEPTPQPRIEDLYDQLKLPDESLGGVYANVVMIRHTPEEFCFDFIANFFPRPVVTCRAFMAAGRIPSFLEAMQSALRRYRPRPPSPPPSYPA